MRPKLRLIERTVTGWGVWDSWGGETPGQMFAVEVGAVGRRRGGPGSPGSPCRAMLTRCCRSGLDRGWCGERGGKDGTGDAFSVPQDVQSFNDSGRSGCGEQQWVQAQLLPLLLPLQVWCKTCELLSELMRRQGDCSVVMDMCCRLCPYGCMCASACVWV